MPPKRAQKFVKKNGFYMFMLELMPKFRQEGRAVNNMAEVSELAAPRWKLLDDKTRKLYDEKAKEYNKQMRQSDGYGGRLDCTGQLLSERVDAKAEKAKILKQIRWEAKKKWTSKEVVADMKFYLIQFQTFCKTIEGEVVPAELGCVEYSLKNGVSREYHDFIDPGPLPIGYTSMAKSNSEDYHKIPWRNFEHASSNYMGMWIKLKNFVNQDEKNEYPPVYCLASEITDVEKCLEWLAKRAGEYQKIRKIADLEGLVIDLVVHGTSLGAPSTEQIYNRLTSSVFDFDEDTKCGFHSGLPDYAEYDAETRHCALGFCKRRCFEMSDMLCEHYGCTITSRHLPQKPSQQVATVVFPEEDLSTSDYRQYEPPVHPKVQIKLSENKKVEKPPVSFIPDQSKSDEPLRPPAAPPKSMMKEQPSHPPIGKAVLPRQSFQVAVPSTSGIAVPYKGGFNMRGVADPEMASVSDISERVNLMFAGAGRGRGGRGTGVLGYSAVK